MKNKHKVRGWTFWVLVALANISLMWIDKDFFVIFGFLELLFYSWFYFVYWGWDK